MISSEIRIGKRILFSTKEEPLFGSNTKFMDKEI
jgi:hypothetical protein